MARRAIVGMAVTALAIAGAGAYIVADAADIAPGWITSKPAPHEPSPFPHAIVPSPLGWELPPQSINADAPLPSAAKVAGPPTKTSGAREGWAAGKAARGRGGFKK